MRFTDQIFQTQQEQTQHKVTPVTLSRRPLLRSAASSASTIGHNGAVVCNEPGSAGIAAIPSFQNCQYCLPAYGLKLASQPWVRKKRAK